MSKKQKGPQSKPSREEVQVNLENLANQILNLSCCLAWTADLLVDKGVFTQEELKAQLDKKREELRALQTPPGN